MTQLGLPNDAPLDACLLMMRSIVKNVRIIDSDGEPPRIDHDLPVVSSAIPDVVSACRLLNDALQLSYEFKNAVEHESLEQDMFLVTTYKYETDQLHKAVIELKLYKEFISSIKSQATCFLSDFVNVDTTYSAC